MNIRQVEADRRSLGKEWAHGPADCQSHFDPIGNKLTLLEREGILDL